MKTDAAIAEEIITCDSFAVEQPSKKLAVFGLIGLSAVFLVSVLVNLPAGDYFTICGFKNFTGLPCPGCGLTHSFCALGKADLVDAFGFNLLGPPLFFVLVLLWIRSGCVLLDRIAVVQRMDRIARRLNIVKAFAVGFAVYGIARIVYLVVYEPASFQNSRFLRMIAGFMN